LKKQPKRKGANSVLNRKKGSGNKDDEGSNTQSRKKGGRRPNKKS